MPIHEIPPLHQLLPPERVRVGVHAASKEAVITTLVEMLADHPAVRDLDAVREAVLRREQNFSTGVGKGLGLPHAKTPGVTETLAAFVLTAQPIDFQAIDNLPVRLVFLLVGPEDATTLHIKILSRLSRLMNRDPFRKKLLEATTAQEILHHLETGEDALVG